MPGSQPGEPRAGELRVGVVPHRGRLFARAASRTHLAAHCVPPALPDGINLSRLVLLVHCNAFDQPAAADEALELPRPAAGGAVLSKQYRVVSRDVVAPV